MKRPKELEAWGRATARKRYAEGGEVDDGMSEESTESPLEKQPTDRAAEVDEFISKVMRDQIKKMGND